MLRLMLCKSLFILFAVAFGSVTVDLMICRQQTTWNLKLDYPIDQ